MINSFSTLYVIGNGFDLFHSLPTKYADFHCFLEKEYPSLLELVEQYFHFDTDENYLWKSFEDDLKSFDHSSFFDDNCEFDPMDERFKPSQIYGLEDALEQESEELVSNLQKAFYEWIETIEIDQTRIACWLHKNSYFVTFNYTMVLEDIYMIPRERIFHIHGDVSNDFEELVFGHGFSLKEEEIFDKNGEPTRTPFTDSIGRSKYPLHALQKKVDKIISDNLERFEIFNGVKEIFILGHSLGDVDMPYLEKICFYAKDACWNVSFHNDDEEIKFKSALESIGIEGSRIRMFKMKDEILY